MSRCTQPLTCAEVKRSRRLKITHHIPQLQLYLPSPNKSRNIRGGKQRWCLSRGGVGAGATFALLATLVSAAVGSSAHFPAGLVSAGGVCLAALAAARSRGRDQSRGQESAGGEADGHLLASAHFGCRPQHSRARESAAPSSFYSRLLHTRR